jgi:A/G-specific adenine glycosylase
MVTRALLDWYGSNARPLAWRRMPDQPVPEDADWPYRVWLAEIMLQQTTTEAVTPYYTGFLARWPSFTALAAADDADVMQAWAGLGYYARARNLLACARAVVAEHGGELPYGEAALRRLPGIGAYTAAAITAFAHGNRAIIIDGNIERVITRLAAIETPLPAARAEIAAALEPLTPDGLEAADWAQGLMDLARRICTPKAPRCGQCPLENACKTSRNQPETYQKKLKKRIKPMRSGSVWWLQVGDEVLTVRRPPRGLLGGMRGLPDAEPPLDGAWQVLGQISHGFTHFTLNLSVHGLQRAEKPVVSGEWVRLVDLDDAGFPTLFQKAITLARAQFAPEAP